MIVYAGLDVHKRVIEACVLDAAGTVVCRERFELTPHGLHAFAKKQLGAEARVALEATTNTWAIVKLLRPLVAEVVVSNPLQTKAIAQAKVKTDKVDAWVLAHLLRCDFLPRVWQPDEGTQRLRHLSSRRASLVGMQTGIKNRLHALLHQRLLRPPKDELFGKAGLAWLQTVSLDEAGRQAIDSELRLLQALKEEIGRLDEALARTAYPSEPVKLLMTLPGVNVTVAIAVLSALGDLSRFRTPDQAASYLGLAPSTKQSAERCYHGPITKAGNGQARWLLVQAAQQVGRHPGPLGHFFRKLAKKKNRNVAVVAVARKLVVIAWHMLTKNEPYRYALAQPTQAKLAKLRAKATGQRRKTGPKKGATAKAPAGMRTRTVKSLAQVLAEEGLPALPPLPPGETRTIVQAGAEELVRSLAEGQRITRPLRQKTVASAQA
jgi:transposase